MKKLRAILGSLEAARKRQDDLVVVKAGLQLGLGFTLVLLAGALFMLAAFSYCPKLHYLNAYLPKDDAVIQFNPKETKFLNQLVSKGIVISASDLYNATISFYSTLITWLIGSLGISGIIAFVYIRGKSKEEAEEQAVKAVDQYFDKASTHTLLAEKIELEVDIQVEPVRKSLESLEDITQIKDALKRLEEKVELLTASIPKTIPSAAIIAAIASPTTAAPRPQASAPAPEPVDGEN